VNFSWTAASDDLSGLDGYTSSAGPLTAATTNTPHTFIGDGDHHNFDLTAYDIAGNTSSTSIGTFWIDTTAPSKPLALSGDQAPSTWTNDNEIAFTWEAAQDALSGIAGYDSTGDDLLDLPSDALTTSVVFPDGLTNEFSLKAADNATNFGPTAGPKGPFWIDTVKPFDASGLTSSQTPGAWTNNPEVTFNWSAASDDLSGLLGYDLDDNDTVDLPADKTGYTISFEDGAENEFHLAAHDNADNIGNDVGPDAGMFWIDTTAPELTEFTSTTNPDGWAQSPVPGTENYDLNIGWVFFEDDLASGITEYETDFGGTTNTTTDSAFDTTGLIEGEYSFLVRAFDFAGNESSWQDFGPLGIDNSAPTAVRDFVSNTHNPGVWTNATAVDFQWLSALDPLAEPTANQGHPGSGVSGYTYNIEGAETGELLPEDLTLAIDMTDSQGEYRVLMTTHDNVGLDSEEYDWGFLRVDYTNPVATSNLNANQPSDVWLNESDIAFNWDPGSDDISGIEQLRDSDQGGYDITGDGVRDLSGLATSFSMHFDDETATTFDFSVVTIDNAGNLSEGNESLGTFKFDLIDPSQASAFNASEVSGEWLIESDVTFTWSASTDADSGLAGYDTDGDGIVDLAPETTEVTLTYPDGIDNNYQLTPWDIAGNDGAPTANLGPFWVDTVAPTMPGNLAADQPAGMPGENWLTDNTVVFTWDASIDETSGIQGYSMNYGQFILGPDATSRSWNMPEGDQMTFTLEAYDNAGHKSDATETLGPFWVDTIAPTQPGNFVAENHLDGQWSNLQWIHFSWDASTDATSGLDHYELDGINIGTVTEDYFEAPEGITEYTLVAVDVAGNESAISTFTLKIDLTAPPAPVQFESPSHPVGDWVSNYNVDLQWVDFALGVGIGSRSTSVDSGFSHYEIDGEDVGTFKRITRHYGNGTHDVQLISVDLAGNRSEPIMLTVLVDTEAPLAPENFTTTSHDLDTWSNNPGVTMAWDAADDGELGGGIDYYLLDGINIGNGLGITNIYAEGQHSYTLVAVDFAGNQSAASTLGEVWIDTTVPVVDSLTSPTHNDSVWNSNMSVTLEWAAHDDVSGVHHYMLNGADVGAALTWDVLQSSDSQYINDLTAVDEAGNESVIATFDAWLDSTLPEISSFASTSHLPGIWTNNADVDLTWAASDATSGLDHFEIDGLNQGLATSVTNTMADGTHAITLGAFDLAHNENQETVEVMIDTNAPVITAFESTSHPDNATWYSNQDVTLTWGANDDHSGVDHYLLDGAEYAATSATLNGLAEGTQTFTLIAVDLVGIQSAPQSVTVNIDVTAPVVTTFASASHAEASWLSNDSVSLNWAATDTFAGVDHYMLDEVDQGLSAGTAFTQTDGTKVYNLYAVDAAGNASAVSTYEVWVDITNPDLASFTSSTHSDDVWSAVDVANFAWSASDATSGILRYELNGEDLALALSDSREYDDGERLMTLTAFDGAENNSSMTFILKVDTAAPALDSFTSGSHISETWYGSDLVTLAWSATEDGSGVTDFSIDGFSYGTALNNGDGVHAGHGIHEFMLVATDAVGNVSEAMTYTVWVDMNGPTVTSFTSTSHTEQEWSADESISFEWAAVDADSGLDHYLFNDADMGLSTSTTEFLVDGVNTFTLVAVDIMGNESEIATFEAWLDSNIPIVDTFTSTSHQDNVWLNNDSVDMIWSGHDTQSGLSHFFVEGSTYAANIAGTTITLADGSHNLTIEAIDLVGHISAVANFQANVDMTDPEITSFTSATHPESTWTSNAVATFNWTGADAHSGISTYMLNGQDVGFVTTANIELADGMHDITLYAIDVAGNTSVIANYSVWVDTTAPSADSFTSSSHAEMTWSNISDVDLAWLGSEAVSEIDHYMLNGIDVGLSTSALHAASEGETVLELYAVDAAGNASNTLTYTVWVDTLNPTLDSFTSGSHTDSVWASNGTLDLAWTSSDATSGLAEYFLDGASVGLDVAAAIALSDGESTHTIYGVDAAGNTSNSLSFTAWVDVTSPSLDSFTSDSHTDSEWASNDTLNLAWAGSDATSGVAEYILNGTSVGMDLAKALTLSDGQHLNEIYAIDEAGNVSATLSFTAWVDVTSPAMSSLTSSSHTDRAWANNGTLDLAWLASDATSGVAEYFLNGASVGLDLSAALPLADGQFLNEIYSVDNAGNASNTLGFTAWIDTTAPALDSLTSSSHTDSVWSADGTLNLAWAGSDDTSGVVEYFLNGVSVGMDLAAALTPGDGETTHTVYAVDAAGISSDTLSFTAWIDTTEPTVDSFTSATHPDGVWVSNDSVELSWAASDEGSAVASYELNGIDVGLDTSATLTPGEGTHSMTLVAYDSVGLVSATSTYEVRIDTILPNLDSLTSSSHIDSVWSTDNALNLAWVGSDDTSGVVEYFLNGASVGMDLAAALTAGEGKNDHTVYSVDAAGNVSATLSFTAWVDTIAPSADSFTSSSHSDGVWSGIADVSLAWTGSDDTSGVVSYFLNGVDMGLSLDMILAQADGENANTLYAVDAAGNQSSTLNFASWIDTDAPSMLSFTSSSHTDSVWGNAAELSLAWAASDNHSGIAEYFLNGVSVGLSLADAFEPGDGVHLNEIYAVDTVGNVSDTLTFTAWIDATIPTVSELASTSHTSHTWSTDGTVDFIWSGSDETSGIDYFDLNGVTYPAGSTGATLILADGVHSVMLVGYDHAGNSDYATFEVWVDTTGPSLGALSSSTHADATWTQSTGLTLEWASAPDDGIGFSHFLLNGSDVGSSLSYSETLASGQHNYELVAVDDLGNESASSFFAAWVDTDTPTIGSFTSSSHTAGVWNASSSVDLTYAASDLHSGLSHLLVNGTLWDGISAVTVADGASTLTLVAVDLVGLESAPVSLDVWVDTTGPTGTLSIDNGGSYTVSSLVDLTLSASDIDSGMSEMRLSNDGATWSTWQVYGASITDWDLTLYGGNGNANEFHTVYVNYRDAVGNTAETSDQIYFLEEIVADSASLSASAAATQTVNFDLAAGPEFAHRAYALYGSALAGSYLLPGGLVSLPFAEDSAMTTIAGAGFPGFEGVLDADGLGAATMNVPVGSIHPLFVGRDLMFALALHDGTGTVYDHVSSTIETIYLDN
ncbi:MAG: hypothetical protein HN405_01485, partial [Planctomycetes bacterium]|nr:hypothetical protein [Planctomycetota bacterium]